MAIRPIVTFPHPVLKQQCAAVEQFDDELATLLDDMRQTMDDADGLGLAANQVGVSLRVFTMTLPESDAEDAPMTHYELVNPEIVRRSGEIRFEEGCLSFPGISETVVRAATIQMRYQDRAGAVVEQTFEGVGAVCAQHELDHLNGVTFLDRLSTLKKRLAMRAYKRARAQAKIDAEEDGRAAVRPWG